MNHGKHGYGFPDGWLIITHSQQRHPGYSFGIPGSILFSKLVDPGSTLGMTLVDLLIL